jgi:AcrR family transcriptional regulator
MLVFWEHGYEATSTDDLIGAMGIGRQSMYAAFGDKHKLYLEALQLYETETGSEFIGRIARAASPFAAISDHVLSVADWSPGERSRGCFFVNASIELAPSDPEVGAMVRANGCRGVDALERLLKEAKRRGEVDLSIDERTAANYLLTTIRGLRVSAKAGVPPEDLRGIAELALSSLKPRGAA